MRRHTAFFVAGAAGLGLCALVVVLAIDISDERERTRASYVAALYDQRRAATVADAAPAAQPAAPTPRTICVAGVDTFAAAIARTLDRPLVERGRLDVAALRWLSSQAVRSHRRSERAHAGPALPQRLGRTKQDVTGEWKPVSPETTDCGGRDAYASIAVEARK